MSTWLVLAYLAAADGGLPLVAPPPPPPPALKAAKPALSPEDQELLKHLDELESLETLKDLELLEELSDEK